MKLANLIEDLNWEQVKENAYFLGINKKDVIDLRKTWNYLKGLVPNKESEEIHISMDLESFYEMKEQEMHVFGFNDYEEEIDISFYRWEDWLNFKIDKKLLYYLSEIEILIYCLKEMNTWGLTNYDVSVNTGQYNEFGTKGNKKKLIYIFNKVGE